MKHAKHYVSLASRLALLGAGLLLAAGAQAQLYKWVGPDGKVTYSDTPPPPSAKRVETKAFSSDDINTGDLPYELAEAVRANPVTLYTGKNCAPCDDGRKMLQERGIPFREKTVSSNDDVDYLRKIAGDNNVPLLLVGRRKESGFQRGTWNTLLSSAGYPDSSRLPKGWRAPSAEAAAPKPAVPEKKEDARNDAAPARELPPATGNAPPGFRF
ncbi:glutaredoxin family protein [Noviherbaspirillum galbum]|uniref:Glutaredoxin family protein n=1 Tax=Noviherbaspirillum galbum TaxID=2709383 RepID=A0A6B3SJP6_9BURK|nr:glutaredoxin family protein [Noviherbaspirillum galbum]NEX60963.1 glutaredoxin family protein [Noviherbaspirillum galbum]